MNDRFKFRVWHITEKRMLYENSEILLDRKQYAYEEWWNSEEYMALNSLKNVFLKFPKVYTLMQCTGLKDKNGKLIYEGDIIVIPNQYPFYDYKNEKESQNLNDTNGEIKGETILNYVGVVEYIFNGWQYVLNCVNPLKRGISNGINYHINEQGFEEDENSCYEVIGNIYENADLLQECE